MRMVAAIVITCTMRCRPIACSLHQMHTTRGG